MSILEAVVLGIIQGLTEFLPVSSTAHLRIVPALLGWEDPGAAFSAVTQIGTLISVLVYFRNDITTMTGAFLTSLRHRKPFETENSRLVWYILFGTIPIGLLGLLLKDFIENEFRSLYVISGSLIVLALLLVLAEKVSRRNKSLKEMSFMETQLIGLAQAVALIPGSSRSGTTITAGLFLNMSREAAARFSFLLSIPAIGLSGVYQLYKLKDAILAGEIGLPLLIATVVSGIVGWAAIDFLMKYLRSHSTYLFIYYRIAAGVLILILLQMHIILP